MAMLEEFVLSTAELRDAFQEAASQGNKYLLVLENTINDEWLITRGEYTRAVKEAKEIVPLLQQLNTRQDDTGPQSLAAVYDLSKDFNQQRSGNVDFKSVLPRQTVDDIDAYTRSSALASRQKDWDRKPFLEKLFSTRPQ